MSSTANPQPESPSEELVAYLDGERPSVVMCRGVYGRIVMAAWDWRDGQLTSRWVFDSGISYPPYRDASPYSGMGGHSVSVGDVDGDGIPDAVITSKWNSEIRVVATASRRHGASYDGERCRHRVTISLVA